MEPDHDADLANLVDNLKWLNQDDPDVVGLLVSLVIDLAQTTAALARELQVIRNERDAQ